ncbi:MAG: 2OG-Fe(II) oxygenase, partial [Cyclobacteriaceae bacterium]
FFGGGLHQSTHGAFLDVHVDFNIHPETGFHRRLNLILYFNKNWKPEYEGKLELWDMTKKTRLENYSPNFNRCVIFETNEYSYHGHPKPLNTPPGTTRKSMALYYYTKDRSANEIVASHNTRYVNTSGFAGVVKNISSSIKALKERILRNE